MGAAVKRTPDRRQPTGAQIEGGGSTLRLRAALGFWSTPLLSW